MTDLIAKIAPAVREICGAGELKLTTLPGGASLRRYHRIDVAGGKPASLVLMELGEDPLRSEEANGKEAPKELPFLNVQRYLRSGKISVPDIYRFDPTEGLIYLEDLGDITFESRVLADDDAVRRTYYRSAIDELIRMQEFADSQPDPNCVAFSRGFDFTLLKWELDHFREYGLEAQGIALSPAEASELERQFKWIAERLAAEPRGFVHRDYQSRNLMVQDRAIGPQLRVIDFQDALLGSRAYDLVGLLRDSYISLSPKLLDELVDYFIDRAGVEARHFRELFALQTVQRKLKDSGRFVFIDRVKKNPSFLVHIPNSLKYVAHALERVPNLASITEILKHKSVI